jgi:putative membrane protein
VFVDYRGSIFGILSWQWKSIAMFLVAAVIVVGADTSLNIEHLRLEAMPVGVVGGAIGIFVSFRTNSAYDRWWEGRKLWGRLINVSRHFTSQALGYIGTRGAEGRELAEALVKRHIAYVHVLRCLLRGQDPLEDEHARAYLSEADRERLRGDSNMTHALLHWQLTDITAEADAGRLDERRLEVMDQSIRVLLDVQGGCERIKKTPMPRGYGYFAERLIWMFSILLPLALVGTHGWLTVPISVIVCFAFAIIGEVGRVLEDPFTMFWPALPLSALSKTIEINLRHRIGETDVPALPKPIDGILM